MEEPRILHLAQDEKFINAAYYLFEKAFPRNNKFVINKPPADPPIRFINEKVQENAVFEVRSSSTVETLRALSRNYEITVLHGFDKVNASVYSESAHKNRFMTIVYGAEVYNDRIIDKKFIGDKTKKLKESTQKANIFDVLRSIYWKMRYRNSGNFDDIDISKNLYDVRVFGSLPSFSYQKFIEKNIYNADVKKIPFTYYPLDFIIKDENLRATGTNILLGNSASATNNHLEAFDLLHEKGLRDKKVIVPLSYGHKRYANAVISYADDLFPNDFKPLTEFLPLDEYNEILSGCGFVIMNHYRPQAMGNIIASLYMGAKVFLNETESYQYFKQLGCHIYLIKEHLLEVQNPFVLLTEEQVAHNRNVLQNELGTKPLVKKMRRSFREIFAFTSSYGKPEITRNTHLKSPEGD